MSSQQENISTEAERLVTLAATKNKTLGTAESCTGGLIGAAITMIPGASRVFMGGIIAYDNKVKQKLLNIPAAIINDHGAVSRDVAMLMAEGTVNALNVDMAVSVTGRAGPGGGSLHKPVGTVWIGTAIRIDDAINVQAGLYTFGDIGRDKVRQLTCLEALKLLQQIVS